MKLIGVGMKRKRTTSKNTMIKEFRSKDECIEYHIRNKIGKSIHLMKCTTIKEAKKIFKELASNRISSILCPLGLVKIFSKHYVVLERRGTSLKDMLRTDSNQFVNLVTDVEAELMEPNVEPNQQRCASVSSMYRSLLRDLFCLTLHLEKKTKLVATMRLSKVDVQMDGWAPRASVLNFMFKDDNTTKGWGQLKHLIERINVKCGIPNVLMGDFLGSLEINPPRSMEAAQNLAIFNDEDANSSLFIQIYHHKVVEKGWKKDRFKDPFGEDWQAKLMSYKNLNWMKEMNDDRVSRTNNKNYFDNQEGQEHCAGLTRHMLVHFAVDKKSISDKYGVFNISSHKRLVSLIMYVFPRAIPNIRRYLVAKNITL